MGDEVYVPGGGIETSSVTTSTTIAGQANQTYTGLTGSTNGNGSGAVFEITRGFSGDISAATVTSAGTGYAAAETVTILGANVGGSTPADNVIVTIDAVSNDGTNVRVEEVIVESGNTTKLVVQGGGGITDGDSVAKVGTPTTSYACLLYTSPSPRDCT